MNPSTLYSILWCRSDHNVIKVCKCASLVLDVQDLYLVVLHRRKAVPYTKN